MKGDGGSVFIEALVGSVIVAFAVLAMIQSVVVSARGDRRIDERRLATLVAQSQLASVGSAIPLAAGASSGSDGRFAWSVQVEASGGEGEHVRLFDVRVAVRGASGTLVTLHTIRAGT